MGILAYLWLCIFLWGHSAVALWPFYMDEYCYSGSEINVGNNDQIRLQLTYSPSYNPNMRCQLWLKTKQNSRLMLYFKNMDIKYTFNCLNDSLEMHDGRTIYDPYIAGGKLCGSSAPYGVFRTSGNYLTLTFRSDSSYHYNSGFDMVVTSYHTGICNSWEHSCDNGRCIDESLTCNGYNPCGDYSDCEVVLTGGAIAGIVIGCCFFSFFIILVILILRRRRRQLFVQQTGTVGPSPYGYNQPVPNQYGSTTTYQQV